MKSIIPEQGKSHATHTDCHSAPENDLAMTSLQETGYTLTSTSGKQVYCLSHV